MSDANSQDRTSRGSLLITLNAVILLALVVFGYQLFKLRDDILAARTLEIRLATLQRDLEGVKNNVAYERSAAYLSKRVDILSVALAAHQGSARRRLDALSEALSAHRGSVRRRLEILSGSIRAQQTSVVHLRKRVDITLAALASYWKRLTYVGKRVDVLSSAFASSRGSVRYLGKRLDIMSSAFTMVNRRITYLAGFKDTVGGALGNVSKRIAGATSRISVVEDGLRGWAQRTEQLEARLDNQE